MEAMKKSVAPVISGSSFLNGSNNMPDSKPLQISAFKDISAFIFYEAQQRFNFNANIYYVIDANEAHSNLMDKSADIVFMSYDDTLSIALQNNYSDIAAIMPVHYGILDLCGSIDLALGQDKIGIDTETGYARALKYYLTRTYTAVDYTKFTFPQIGATNLRYLELVAGTVNATLLNPPFNYEPHAPVIARICDQIGPYQGVAANINKSWAVNPDNQTRLNNFIATYSQTIQFIMHNPGETIVDLEKFYNLSEQAATAIYDRLLQPDGLSLSTNFNASALSGSEKIFTWDSGTTVPTERTWIISN